jgi:hypothetical protein
MTPVLKPLAAAALAVFVLTAQADTELRKQDEEK